jgi:mono/diheme cytochrome c family protein
MSIRRLVACCAFAALAAAQSPKYGVGHAPNEQEILALSFTIAPDGTGLPKGSGTAVEGRAVYARHCANCHGEKGADARLPLVGGQGSLATAKPLKTVGSFWPYATSVWNYVNRAMPFDHPGLLSPPEVYAVVAHVLYLNAIVKENDVLDAKTLPKIRMPNRDGFVPDPRPDVGR